MFDYFCEKNCLALLVDLITGRAITPQTSDASAAEPTAYLPPGAVAVQVIQTISLLVSNVKENTSLFYILSNNYINEVIEFEPWKGYGKSRDGGEGREEVREGGEVERIPEARPRPHLHPSATRPDPPSTPTSTPPDTHPTYS